MVEVDRLLEGPCKRESREHLFTADFEKHLDCIQHCQKIAWGKSPPVITLDEWESFTREVDLITSDRSRLPWMWLSATEGDVNSHLERLSHWPEDEKVENKRIKLDAEEGIWRNYTGLRLTNWTKPYYHKKGDGKLGDTYNCIDAFLDESWNQSWRQWECASVGRSCLCKYPVQPILQLRGLCKASLKGNGRWEYTHRINFPMIQTTYSCKASTPQR